MNAYPLLMVFLFAAGCAGIKPSSSPTGPAQGGAAAVEPTDASRATLPAPPVAVATTTVAAPSVPAEQVPKKKVVAPHAATPPTGATPTAPVEQVRKKSVAAPVAAKPSAPPLDLATLKKRLRETDAIGAFTKIALKNQVDDLLGQFRAYYQGRRKTTLSELRQPYEMLLLKTLSLLQDSDPALARTIVASREAIWGVLADPVKFATL